MKIYFTGSLAAKQKYLKNYEKIIEYLKKNDHQVIADHIIDSSESKIRMSTREDRLSFHSKLEKWIQSADCMIAETSFPSISVGYEISLALRMGKPVLVMYSEGDPPSLLAHHKDEKLLCERYTQSDFADILDDFLTYVKSKQDLRFTFFITPQIIAYLDNIAKHDKVPKSVYIRKLIETDMKKHMK